MQLHPHANATAVVTRHSQCIRTSIEYSYHCYTLIKYCMKSLFRRQLDLDNLVKFVLDSLNGQAYEDDSQIAAIRCAKFYSDGEPYTKVIIRSLADNDIHIYHS
jgi:Holliday junction resolvase RusA-like endonuclease